MQKISKTLYTTLDGCEKYMNQPILKMSNLSMDNKEINGAPNCIL